MSLPIADIMDATPLVLAGFAGVFLVGFALVGLRKRTAGVTLILLTVVAMAVYLAVATLVWLGADKSFN